ncbi:alpha/beta fold hydrolase [Candidatus Villigracilis proximus]|uniref:alpha/beta hydrolase family protein n=1 Tax=Candidatus Villigracilis proximus TaxID=3140683 RepID=UPI0031E64CA7
MKKLLLVLMIVIVFITACTVQATLPASTPVAFTETTAATETLIPTSTFTMTPPPTATPIPHPMSIVAMRAGEYPGSEITIVKELDKGANYRRYYSYYLSEGLKIYALLTVPEGEMPEGGWPAIVFNHGYIPPDVYKTTERYIAYVDEIARSGYVVFRIDYRGHDASEGEATGAYGHPGYQIDVLNAVSSIQQLPEVNPDKIGMWGHSMGGYLTLRTMVISKDVKVGVIWAGVVASYTDLLYNWRRTGFVHAIAEFARCGLAHRMDRSIRLARR